MRDSATNNPVVPLTCHEALSSLGTSAIYVLGVGADVDEERPRKEKITPRATPKMTVAYSLILESTTQNFLQGSQLRFEMPIDPMLTLRRSFYAQSS